MSTKNSTPTVKSIIAKNIITPFNIINLLLAAAVFFVGSPRNAIFFGVAIINTAMGIFQELRAKHTLDRLAILARGKVTAIRRGKEISIEQAEVVIGDILVLSAGNQIIADAKVIQSASLEIDESLLTGESNAIIKKSGDAVLSGSFVVAGSGQIQVTAIGDSSYAGRLANEAKQMKKPSAPLIQTLNAIIKVLAFVIIPLGALLFYRQLSINHGDTQAAVLAATASMVGMIPEGLILLTGITLTVGAVKLSRKKALVQSLYSIETLARVDVLCLDKTGTITDGTLTYEQIIPLAKHTDKSLSHAIGETIAAIGDTNATAKILRETFSKSSSWQATSTIPFSSRRKWSAASFESQGTYVIGAPNFVFPENPPAKLYKVSSRVDKPYLHEFVRGAEDLSLKDKVSEHINRGQRVLILAHSSTQLSPSDKSLPQNLKPIGLIILSDHIRPAAKKTFKFFAREGVQLKVISGDDAKTVSIIASRAGIADADSYIDMSKVEDKANYQAIATQHTVFGRVSPEQKKYLVAALKSAKHIVCMTGDGVNDVLALKEADCGVAMVSGSDAARASADFVLMTSDFSAMVGVLKEGRRVINNIENVASLYLVKTIYSVILTIYYMFIPYAYPFTPLQMTPINVFAVGIPSFFLALRPLYSKPKGKFLTGIIENSLSAAVTIVLGILAVRLISVIFDLPETNISTINIIVTAIVGFAILLKISKPLGASEAVMVAMLIAAFIGTITSFPEFLGYDFSTSTLPYLAIIAASPLVFYFVSRRLATNTSG